MTTLMIAKDRGSGLGVCFNFIDMSLAAKQNISISIYIYIYMKWCD